MFWVPPEEEVRESGYATEQTLKVAYDQSRSEFCGRGTVVGFERYGYCRQGIEMSVAGWTIEVALVVVQGRTTFLSYGPKLGLADGR